MRRFAPALALVAFGAEARAELPTHPGVVGADIATVEVDGPATKTKPDAKVDAGAPKPWETAAWDDLGRIARAAGTYTLRFRVNGVDAVELGVCAGRRKITIDGVPVATQGPAPAILRLSDTGGGNGHEITIEVAVSGYEKRIACGAPPRAGAIKQTHDGLSTIAFASPHGAQGGGKALVFVPPGHDSTKPGPLLIGAHPWDGSMWTYAAYAELLREAASKDVVLLMPSGLGNSLYTASAEEEVMRALDALGAQIAVDPRRISIWGASMGGAGATTIGLHRPDRFATITSFFGDSRYDLSTYVSAILKDEAAAHAVNSLDVVDNARHVPVWLIHGEDDHVSPITQSSMLARALTERHYTLRFDRVPKAGHEGALVARFLPEIVARAAEARSPEHPPRVTFRSVRDRDTEAYGVRLVRSGGDAFVDLERREATLHVLRASGIKSIALAKGAFGATGELPIVWGQGVPPVEVRWEK
jgi:pimeloyl-ACP methyl ester carboxylesterase